MTVEKLDIETLSKIRDLAKIEKEFGPKLSVTDLFKDNEGLAVLLDMAIKADTLHEEIANIIVGQTHIVVQDPTAARILDKIRKESPFKSIHFLRSLMEVTGNLQDDPLQYSDVAMDDLTLNHDHIEYYLRKRKLGALICNHQPQIDVEKYYWEIKEAYAFELHRACVGLCRALLEMVLRRKLRNAPDDLSSMISQAQREHYLDPPLAERAHNVRESANNILHLLPRAESTPPNVEGIILDTLEVVEHLLGRIR